MPAYPILVHATERRAVCQLFIELVGVFRETAVEAKALDVEVDLVMMLVSCAILIGHVDNQPMTALKISHFIGIPRTTVLRKLDALLEMGAIVHAGPGFLLSKVRAENFGFAAEAHMRVLSRAADALCGSPLMRRPKRTPRHLIAK